MDLSEKNGEGGRGKQKDSRGQSINKVAVNLGAGPVPARLKFKDVRFQKTEEEVRAAANRTDGDIP